MKKAITLALIGAGNRGRGIFGQYALDMPHCAKFVAVVEPDDDKRTKFAVEHGISGNQCFASTDEFFAKPQMADAVVIATLESEREEPVFGAIANGYHILVEKPLGCTPEQVVRICDAARNYSKTFIVCHQMRHTPIYGTIKKLIDSGEYGKIVAIQHSENLAYTHMAHSFVRGFFNNDRMTPMILAKSCHDMDILRHLINRRPLRINSFGSLNYFHEGNAPEGAPSFCLEGCPAEEECPYHVMKLYFGEDADPAYLRQMGVIRDKEHLRTLLCSNRFGRCVYRCDNNVVDQQVVQIQFDDGITASFAMIGHNYLERRMTKISLDNGEIEFDGKSKRIYAATFSPPIARELSVEGCEGTHGGGDLRIMDSFVKAVRSGDKRHVLTSVEASLDSHLMAFAAEKSRKEGRVIELADYEEELRRSL